MEKVNNYFTVMILVTMLLISMGDCRFLRQKRQEKKVEENLGTSSTTTGQPRRVDIPAQGSARFNYGRFKIRPECRIDKQFIYPFPL
ncbi:hypothetical protein CHUAL_012230 [Chamberlinius hualienensis]